MKNSNSIHRNNRRGITLLFVISMIVLFLLMGTTFMLVANDFYRDAKRRDRAQIKSIANTDVVEQAFYDLIRGPSLYNTNSPLRGHSILGDMYGYGYKGTVVVGVSTIPQTPSYYPGASSTLQSFPEQFYQLALLEYGTGATASGLTEVRTGDFIDPSLVDIPDGEFNGQLLTFTTGLAKGLTTRIITHRTVADPLTTVLREVFVLRPVFDSTGASIFDVNTRTDEFGAIILDEYLINGREFSGHGAGVVTNNTPEPGNLPTTADYFDNPPVVYDTAIHRMSDLALQPNRRGQSTQELTRAFIDSNGNDLYDTGEEENPLAYLSQNTSPNEPYDALDFQNMFLSGFNYDMTATPPARSPVASFHRNKLFDSGVLADFSPREITFRPLIVDEVNNVTGLAPGDGNIDIDSPANDYFPNGLGTFSAADLDVDTDGDGELDAVWIDIGLPEQTAADGRRVRPLVAYRVVDMGGKLNINAMGQLAELYTGRGTFEPMSGTVAALGKGQGPNEISLSGVISSVPDLVVGTPSAYERLINDRYYGERPTGFENQPGTDAEPGNQTFSVFQKLYGYPLGDSFVPTPGGLDSYGRIAIGTRDVSAITPPVPGLIFPDNHPSAPGNSNRSFDDLLNDSPSVVVNNTMPTTDLTSSNFGFSANTTLASVPSFGTSFSLSGSRGDNLFNEADLERVLRLFDQDANLLSSRLMNLEDANFSWTTPLPITGNVPRNMITSRSFDLSVPAAGGFEFVGATARLRTARVKLEHNPIATPTYTPFDAVGLNLLEGATPADVAADLLDRNAFIDRDLILGGRMNINTPLGNGVDDNDDFGDDTNATVRTTVFDLIDEYYWNHDLATPAWVFEGDPTVGGPGTRVQRAKPKPGQSAPGDPNTAHVMDLDNGGDALSFSPALEPTPPTAPRSNFIGDQLAAQNYVRRLYLLALAVCGDQAPTGFTPLNGPLSTDETNRLYRRMIAQWAVNILDYRDQDSIHTPFFVDLDPFDATGWDADIDVFTGAADQAAFDAARDVTDTTVVWGVERPELLITETMATVDRRTENLDTDDNGAGGEFYDPADPTLDDDYDTRLLPTTFACIELYNPWTVPTTNPLPAGYLPTPMELIDVATNTGVDLEKIVGPAADSPVWRMGVKNGGGGRPADETTLFDKLIYFVDAPAAGFAADDSTSDPTIDAAADVFYTSVGTSLGYNMAPVAPGQFAVIGSSGEDSDPATYRTTFGRRIGAAEGSAASLQLAQTRSIELDPAANSINTYDFDGSSMSAQDPILVNSIAVIDSVLPGGSSPGVLRSLSLTAPNGGYEASTGAATITNVGDGFAIDDTVSMPLDTPLETEFTENGVTKGARVLYLQRLANPLLSYHQVLNPYITIDTSAVDVLAYNGIPHQTVAGLPLFDNDNDNLNDADMTTPLEPNITAGTTNFYSLERGENGERELFRTDQGIPEVADTVVADTHTFSFAMDHTLGTLNDAFLRPTANPSSTKPYTWLAHNNRIFVSQNELGDVPITDSERLTLRFASGGTDADNIDAMLSTLCRTDFNQLPDLSNRLGRILDFLEVPNKFAGDNYIVNNNPLVEGAPLDIEGDYAHRPVTVPTSGPPVISPMDVAFYAPFNYVPSFRSPGKINLNTIFHQEVWDALLGESVPRGMTGYAGFGGPDFFAFITDRQGTTMNAFTDAENFYATGSAGEYIPPANIGTSPLLMGVFTARAGGQVGLMRDTLENSSAEDHADGSRNSYFNNEIRRRLGNLTTCRSSVFAIWITIGYFEVDSFGRLGSELGSDEGAPKRNRAFYMYDRSIPVAFEPGSNHNVDRGILLKSIIE